MLTVETPGNMRGLRLVVYVRVSREDERPENQKCAIFRWAAVMKRELICQRIREVPARLKAQGKYVGRSPKWSEATRRRIIDLMKKSFTLKEAYKLTDVGYRTALKYLSKGPEYLKARLSTAR